MPQNSLATRCRAAASTCCISFAATPNSYINHLSFTEQPDWGRATACPALHSMSDRIEAIYVVMTDGHWSNGVE